LKASRLNECPPKRRALFLGMKIEALRDDPFPAGCKKMEGLDDGWRIRSGDYRVIYAGTSRSAADIGPHGRAS